MPLSIDAPRFPSTIAVQPLTQQAFAAFGTVIENPSPNIIPSATLQHVPEGAVRANQGSALKFPDVSKLPDLYSSAPSKTASRACMSMFVCAPRLLQASRDDPHLSYFPVEILERHPFTTQTFIPLGLSHSTGDADADSRYLVIVAPSREPSDHDQRFPVPPPDASTDAQGRLPGRGLPDLTRLEAFVATSSQAVAYGAGTWHAPMVVVGGSPVSFVVVQYANGVGIEDCQEVTWDSGKVKVSVPKIEGNSSSRRSKL
jgi:ureidoglycolate lyase